MPQALPPHSVAKRATISSDTIATAVTITANPAAATATPAAVVATTEREYDHPADGRPQRALPRVPKLAQAKQVRGRSRTCQHARIVSCARVKADGCQQAKTKRKETSAAQKPKGNTNGTNTNSRRNYNDNAQKRERSPRIRLIWICFTLFGNM